MYNLLKHNCKLSIFSISGKESPRQGYLCMQTMQKKFSTHAITIENGIFLKELQKENANTLFYAISTNREYLRKWLPWVDSTQVVNDSYLFIQEAIKLNKEKKALILGLWRENNLLGVTSLINIENRSAELGYWIVNHEQGKGIITLSCKALISHAFASLPIDTITVRCVSENYKSLKIIQSLCATCEVIEELQWIDKEKIKTKVVKGTLDRNEWQSLHNKSRMNKI